MKVSLFSTVKVGAWLRRWMFALEERTAHFLIVLNPRSGDCEAVRTASCHNSRVCDVMIGDGVKSYESKESGEG